MPMEARQSFYGLSSRTLVSWSKLITGYVQQGKAHEALNCFEQMRRDGISPDVIILISILKACGRIRSIEMGVQIHEHISDKGLLDKNIVVGNALVDMYAKCGVLVKAQQVHDKLPVRNVISWSALILGYVQQGKGHEALNCFEQMQGEGLTPNAITLSCILKACGSTGAIDKGSQIHDMIVSTGLLDEDIVLGNAVVDMYAKCGMLSKAQEVHDDLDFRNVVSWNALVTGYAQHAQSYEALNCIEQMRNQGLLPDAITFVSILKACGAIGTIDKGKHIHNEVLIRHLLKKNVMLGTAVVDMYSKCGDLVRAQKTLEELSVRNKISWSVLIAGYVEQGQGHKALDCFERMQSENLLADEITFVWVLKACGIVGAIDKGKKIHSEIMIRSLIAKNIVLGTALVDMYGKCGAPTKAHEVLEELPARNVISWSALIAGYAQQGYGSEALDCLEKMERDDGLSPNSVTFLCVLNACSHSGLVDEAETYYGNMSSKYGITPNVEHFTCMVTIFGYAGQFDKAVSVIESMSSSDYHPVWLTLLAACNKWGNVKLGRLAFDQTIQQDEACAAVHVLMANIYAAANMYEDAEKVEDMRRNAAWKKPEYGAWVAWVDPNENGSFYTRYS